MIVHKCDKCNKEFKDYKEESLKVSVHGRSNNWRRPSYIYQSFYYCKKCLADVFGLDLNKILNLRNER